MEKAERIRNSNKQYVVQTKVIYRAIIKRDSYDEPPHIQTQTNPVLLTRPRNLNHIVHIDIFNIHLIISYLYTYVSLLVLLLIFLELTYLIILSEDYRLWSWDLIIFLYFYQLVDYFCASLPSNSKGIYNSVILGRGRAVFISARGFDINLLFQFCLKVGRVISEQRRK